MLPRKWLADDESSEAQNAAVKEALATARRLEAGPDQNVLAKQRFKEAESAESCIASPSTAAASKSLAQVEPVRLLLSETAKAQLKGLTHTPAVPAKTSRGGKRER